MDDVDDAAGSVRAVSLHRKGAALPPVRSAQDSASRADFAVFYEQQMPRLVGQGGGREAPQNMLDHLLESD
ncbi:hypothetical protein [Streptomyces umbrinus]|uniref:hypothetical protein n=1 Tax=Streptomyces umbrinus TaxID=67370 RepID=UPI00340A7A79